MPRMQLYLPENLYELVKSRGLPASELLQNAIRAEVRRLDLLSETDRYVAGLIAEVGMPTEKDREHAAALTRRLDRRVSRKAG
jgi:post-segregation antitoxin (ccd killing protein)